jgi:hypothetical protein
MMVESAWCFSSRIEVDWTKGLHVQLHDGDLPIVAGGVELVSLAVDLARSLDVPVSLPP